MPYSINHVHIRAENPARSATWYEQYFDSKILFSREVMPGTITIAMDVGGPATLNISSQPPGSSDKTFPAQLNTLGLEHFGFSTTDIEKDIHKFENAEVAIMMEITEIPGGAKLAYIEGPDNVIIELVQSSE